jgi:hypothetical protein
MCEKPKGKQDDLTKVVDSLSLTDSITPADSIPVDSIPLVDTIPPIDSIPIIDTCTSDTCFTCNLGVNAELIYNELMKAYRNDCISCLEQILINWRDEFHPNSNIPDSLKDVYDVYKEFYSPWDLARISESEFGHDIYKNVTYYIIQSTCRYDYYFRNYGNEFQTITEFRPSIKNEAINLLYLSPVYESAINCFLGSEYIPAGYYNIMTPALPQGESYLRYEFLRNFLRFFHGHWGNYWHLETHPEVERISFNITKDSAQVFFRLGYQGGEVILGRDSVNWIIVDHYMTWIE